MLKPLRGLFFAAAAFAGSGASAAGMSDSPYARQAREVTRYIQETYWSPGVERYRDTPGGNAASVWAGGIMFSTLVAATRHDETTYRPLLEAYYRGLEGYWDRKAPIHGYEPYPTQGGNDKYYDDNAWLVISMVEAYEVTHSPVYLRRATDTLKFVLSGHDQKRGGGIWWHEGHKDGTKNTCVTAPAAVGCQRVAKYSSGPTQNYLLKFSENLVTWTQNTLQNPDGLYGDRIEIESGKLHTYPLTYNTALMIRAHLGLYHATGQQKHLDEAIRLGHLSDAFVNKDTGAYRDPAKWSHLLIEADLTLFRETGKQHFYDRAKTSTDHYYKTWTETKPGELIEDASIARALWLMADMASDKHRQFWKKSDAFQN